MSVMPIDINYDPYEFDMDKNGLPAFTDKNFLLLNAMIKNDSQYRASFDYEASESSANFLNNKFPKSLEDMKRAVTLIDNENSTHISVTGDGKTSGTGRKIMAESLSKLYEKGELESAIEEGNIKIVDEIKWFIKGRENISFASKFCTYCNRYCFGRDDYSIYDKVVAEILPYYAYAYLGEDTHWFKNRNGNVKSLFIKENSNKEINYEVYWKVIGRVIEKVEEKTSVKVSRNNFDLLLWYYFKGPNDRIMQAYKCYGNQEAKLFDE